MIFGFADKIKVSDMKVEIENLKRDNANLSHANQVMRSRLEGEMANATFAINWDVMNAFSVERNWSNGFPVTIIGYLLQEPAVHTEEQVTYKDVVREWTLHCSAAEHERLVAEFNAHKNK